MVSDVQKRTFMALLLTALIYFVAFFFPNSKGIDKAGMQSIIGDEYVTYPNVLRILTPGKSFYETRANLFLYEDYHYGYPFYAFSALTLLPVRLIFGESFYQQGALNLMLLRQFISVLPMILAAGILVYLQTRFQSMWKSIALFVFILLIRGVVRNNLWWWHPDALAVFCVVLTIFFLIRDRLRLGWDFYLAAAACGLATAIKLTGLFFFLTIPGYILAACWKNRLDVLKIAAASALFVVVMGAVTVLSNPFLFSDDQRARMVMIQEQKREEIDKGYSHDNAIYYSKGPRWWVSTLEKWYGPPAFLLFIFAFSALGCFVGPKQFENRIILSFVIPYSIYMLYFVAPKPDHYWLPVMLPLFSTVFSFFDVVSRVKAWRPEFVVNWPKLAEGLMGVILFAQFTAQILQRESGLISAFIILLKS